MPSSAPFTLGHVCNRIIERNPVSVLDIGVGFGKFGFLAREYTDIWHLRYWDWKAKIDGIEIFEKYIGELQKKVYDEIFIGNAIHILPFINNYDMIICSDVLEHFTVADGNTLLDLIKVKSKFAMIMTPIVVLEQGATLGNENERHLSSWTRKELSKWGRVYPFGSIYLLEIVGE